MAIKIFSIKQLHAFAKAKGLKLVMDPFHGATAYEFQKKISRGHKKCVGCIIGPMTSVLYTRTARRGGSENYLEHESMETSDLSETCLIEFTSKQLCGAECP